MRAMISLIALGLAGLALPSTARAGTPEGAMASCHISVSPLVFPPYDGMVNAGSSAIGAIQVECPPDVPSVNPRILLSAGRSGRFADRRMTSGNDSLRYNLFLEPSHLRVVGDGSGGSVAITSPSAQTRGRSVFTIYGRILAGQAVSPGHYSDDLIIQMEF